MGVVLFVVSVPGTNASAVTRHHRRHHHHHASSGVGTVQGTVFPGSCGDPRSGCLEGSSSANIPVQAIDADGHVAASTTTDDLGQFTLVLEAGRYRVEDARTGDGQLVTVRAGQTTVISIHE